MFNQPSRRRSRSRNYEPKDLEDHMSRLNVDNKRDVNILLFGETGVGKSTFINAFYNYLNYFDLKDAMKHKPMTLIPTKFTIMDENFEEQVVEVGADKNEYIETGVSATQATKSYVFPLKRGSLKIRLIDTPGIADTRGVDLDNSNFENILDFIGELKYLNAICILLTPNNPRITVQFEYCIKQLLSKLDKSACNNLVFIFTNSRCTFYRPGETLPALKKMFQEIQNVQIGLVKDNMFCVDNEAFRFWTAYNTGIKFSSSDIESFSQSWKQSFKECWRLIDYIVGNKDKAALEPHVVKNTITINEARRLIVNLSQPLAEIAQLIEDNITVLQRHKKELISNENQITALSSKLYIPFVNLNVTKLDQPATVCTSTKCSELYDVNGVQKWHYKQKCHSPCYLKGIPKEIIGSPLLANCNAMGRQPSCRRCGCEYQKHMHIYYETKTVEDKLEDVHVKSKIKDKKFVAFQAKNIIDKIGNRLHEFKEEKEVILKTTAKFAHFLQTNAITPYNDAYEGYLLYLIDREKSLGAHVDYKVVRELESMLNRYKEEKEILSNAMNGPSGETNAITADQVIESVKTLYELKHNGSKIKQLFLSQKSARKDENKSEAKESVYLANGNKKKSNNCRKNFKGNARGRGRGAKTNMGQKRQVVHESSHQRSTEAPSAYPGTERYTQQFKTVETVTTLKMQAPRGEIDFNEPPTRRNFGFQQSNSKHSNFDNNLSRGHYNRQQSAQGPTMQSEWRSRTRNDHYNNFVDPNNRAYNDPELQPQSKWMNSSRDNPYNYLETPKGEMYRNFAKSNNHQIYNNRAMQPQPEWNNNRAMQPQPEWMNHHRNNPRNNFQNPNSQVYNNPEIPYFYPNNPGKYPYHNTTNNPRNYLHNSLSNLDQAYNNSTNRPLNTQNNPVNPRRGSFDEQAARPFQQNKDKNFNKNNQRGRVVNRRGGKEKNRGNYGNRYHNLHDDSSSDSSSDFSTATSSFES